MPFAVLNALADPTHLTDLLIRLSRDLVKEAGAAGLHRAWKAQAPATRAVLRRAIQRSKTKWDDDFLAMIDTKMEDETEEAIMAMDGST